MRVLVITNPKSGRGRAVRRADRLSSALQANGCTISRTDLADFSPPISLGSEAVIAVGGDGTAIAVLDALRGTSLPMAHLGTGNENLFARWFGMPRNPETLAEWMLGAQTTPVDLGVIGSTRFAIMASIGPDAGVIARLANRRTRAIGHAAYTRPVLEELISPTIPTLRISVDGVHWRTDRGMLIISNIPAYALRIDPSPDAMHADGLLHVAFLPVATRFDFVSILSGLRARTARDGRHVYRARGQRVTCTLENADTPVPFQFDGEHGGWLNAESPQINLGVERGAATVYAAANRITSGHHAPLTI